MRRPHSRKPAVRDSRTSQVRSSQASPSGPAPLGGEYANPGSALGRAGEYFGAIDASYRSSFSSSPSASKYLVVEGYSLLNARVGFRAADGWTLSLWARNLLDKEYFDLLSPVAGGTGLYVGQPGDRRTVGVTMRISLRSSRP